jgi:hypothetical protein
VARNVDPGTRGALPAKLFAAIDMIRNSFSVHALCMARPVGTTGSGVWSDLVFSVAFLWCWCGPMQHPRVGPIRFAFSLHVRAIRDNLKFYCAAWEWPESWQLL